MMSLCEFQYRHIDSQCDCTVWNRYAITCTYHVQDETGTSHYIPT